MPTEDDQPHPGDDAAPAVPDRPARAGFFDRLRRDMTRNEQLVVYLGAVIALGINLFVAVSPGTVTHATKSAHVSTPVVAVIGVASFLLLSGAARYGRRTVGAIVSLLVSFVTAQPLGYVYIALGAWLFYKGTRAQRERLAAERGSGSAPSSTRPGRAGRAPSGTGARGSAPRGRGRQPEPPRRPASKRYTPPGTKGRRR